MLSLESTGSRLYRLASFALHQEPFLTLDQVLRKLESVGEADVAAAAAFFHPQSQLLLKLGPSA